MPENIFFYFHIYIFFSPQVLSPTGEFVRAVPIPGTIVINAGDMLRDWSKGQFKATTHRVVVTTDSTRKSVVPQRQSMAFFCHPNYDVVIGENKESSYQYLSRRFDETIVHAVVDGDENKDGSQNNINNNVTLGNNIVKGNKAISTY